MRDAIEDYLDQVMAHASLARRDQGRVRAELKDHLAELVGEAREHSSTQGEITAMLEREFGKPEVVGKGISSAKGRVFVWDGVALKGNGVVVVLAGLAGIVLGFAAGLKRGDGILGVHVGTIGFAYLIPLLLAVVGTYAIFRDAIVKLDPTQFRDRFARQCRFLLGVVALVSATGVILGAVWAERHWGRFWGWDAKEIGGLSVVVAALVLNQLLTRFRPGSVQLGQASLIMSLVTFVAWFGPEVYMKSVGPSLLAVLVICLVAQLAILSISVFLSKCTLA